MSRVLVAVSGGVDSSVAAFLLAREGHDVRAVTMRLFCHDDAAPDRACCSGESIATARAAMQRIGVGHWVADIRDLFRDGVMNPFYDTYAAGETPNPCVACNTTVRFPVLARMADEMGCDFVATGHFVRRVETEAGLFLGRAADRSKDQSYFLWGLDRAWLTRCLFPLGGLTKTQVRAIAREAGLPNADRRESQDVCFVRGEDYRDDLKRRGEDDGGGAGAEGGGEPGPIVLASGETVGRHSGIARFTIGQRKGIGVSSAEPLYVLRIVPETNTVVVGAREALLCGAARVRRCNWFGDGPPGRDESLLGAVRYRGTPSPCRLRETDGGEAGVEFDPPVWAPAPGQSLVLYRDDLVVGGGVIREVEFASAARNP